MQVTTLQRNHDGSHAVAEALTYIPGMNIDISAEPRKLVSVYDKQLSGVPKMEVNYAV